MPMNFSKLAEQRRVLPGTDSKERSGLPRTPAPVQPGGLRLFVGFIGCVDGPLWIGAVDLGCHSLFEALNHAHRWCDREDRWTRVFHGCPPFRVG